MLRRASESGAPLFDAMNLVRNHQENAAARVRPF